MSSGLDLFNALMMRAAPSRRRRGRGEKAAWAQAGGEPLQHLARDIRKRLAEVEPTEEDKQCIQECIKEMEAALPSLGSGSWEIQTFGSVASGFVVRDSDVDVTCLRTDRADRPAADSSSGSGGSDDTAEEGSAERERMEEPERILRERWQPLLAANPRFTVTEEVLFAKVPILKIQFDGHLDIDLSCGNTMALQNTRLLKAYADMHPRVRELGIAVKLWAKAAQVCGASRRHLSSYTFTLMTIYFLEVSEELSLPYLPTACFEEGADGEDDPKVQAARKTWKSQLASVSTAQLVVNFFVFYNFFFQWGHEVISVRLGSRHLMQEPVFEKLRGRWTRRLHIEDPYLLDRNLHCVLGEEEEAQLRLAFATAFQALQFGQPPVGLRSKASEKASWADLSANADECLGGDAPADDAEEDAKMTGTGSTSVPMAGLESLIEDLLDEVDGEEEEEEEEETSTAESRGAGGASSDEHGEASADPPSQNWQWWKNLGSASVAKALDGRSDGPGALPAALAAAAAAMESTAPAPKKKESRRQRAAKGNAAGTSDTAEPQHWLSARVLEAAIAEKSIGDRKCINVKDLEENLGGPAQQQAQPMRTGSTEAAGSNVFATFAARSHRSTGGIAARVNRLCRAGNEPTVAVV